MIFDQELLSEAFGQDFARYAAAKIYRAARRKSGDYTHRPGWIRLRPGDDRQSRKCRGAPGQVQKLSTMEKFHTGLGVTLRDNRAVLRNLAA